MSLPDAPLVNAETERIVAALNGLYPPTNPAVLLSAARDLYLNGATPGDRRNMARLLVWCLNVLANNSPDAFTNKQIDDITRLYLDTDV